MCRRRFRCIWTKPAPDCGPWRENPQSNEIGKRRGQPLINSYPAVLIFASNRKSFHVTYREWCLGYAQKIKRSQSIFVPQLLQEYQMMPDCPGHGGVLPIRASKLFGGLLHDPGQRSVMGMAHERTKVVDDVMVEPAREPTHKRVLRRIIGGCREDVIHAVFKLATIRGKVSAVDSVRRLEYEGYA